MGSPGLSSHPFGVMTLPGLQNMLAPPATADASEGSGRAGRPILIFAVASVVTLVAGMLLERSGNQLANNWGMNGVAFGATFLAAATALPEISTGITGVRLARYTLVFGDMFGGNAFQLTLFFVADQPVLPAEGKSNAWIGGTCPSIATPRRRRPSGLTPRYSLVSVGPAGGGRRTCVAKRAGSTSRRWCVGQSNRRLRMLPSAPAISPSW
jgi:hypothetical protein